MENEIFVLIKHQSKNELVRKKVQLFNYFTLTKLTNYQSW